MTNPKRWTIVAENVPFVNEYRTPFTNTAHHSIQCPNRDFVILHAPRSIPLDAPGGALVCPTCGDTFEAWT